MADLGRRDHPGQEDPRLTVFATDTRAPDTRARMALRALIYNGGLAMTGLLTLGLVWVYNIAAALGSNRRTIPDGWSQVPVLTAPAH